MERSPAAPAKLASRLSPRAEREPARAAPIDLGEGASGELPVTKPGARAGRRDPAELVRHGLAHGSSYVRPRWIVRVEEPPLTGSSEIDRQAIARKLRALRAALAPVRDA